MIRARRVGEDQKQVPSKTQPAAATSISRFDAVVSPPNHKKQFSWSTTGDDVASVEQTVEDFVSSDAVNLQQRDEKRTEKPAQKKTISSEFATPKHIKLPVHKKPPSEVTAAHDKGGANKETNRKRNKRSIQSIIKRKEAKKEDKAKSLSHDDIRKIVIASMERAQQSARTEIESMVAKVGKETTNRKSDYLVFQKEIASIALDAMHRARESAQNEIRGLVKESFRRAPESEQAQIRQMVRESMQKARERAKEEMSGLVRKIVKLHTKAPRENSKGSGQELFAETQRTKFHKRYPSRSKSTQVLKSYEKDKKVIGDKKTLGTPAAKDSTRNVVPHVVTSLAEKPMSCERSSKRCSVYLSPGPGRLDYQFFGSDTVDTQQRSHKPKRQEYVPFDETCNRSVGKEQDKVARTKTQNVTRLELDNSELIESSIDRDEKEQDKPTLNEAIKPRDSDLVSPVSSMDSSQSQASERSCTWKKDDSLSPMNSMGSLCTHPNQTQSRNEANQYPDSPENSMVRPSIQQPQISDSETKKAPISPTNLKTDSQDKMSSQNAESETKHDPVSSASQTTSSPMTKQTVRSPLMREEAARANNSPKNLNLEGSPSGCQSSPRILSTPSMQEMIDPSVQLLKEDTQEGVKHEINKRPLSPFPSSAAKTVQSPQRNSPRNTEQTTASVANQNPKTELLIGTGSKSMSLEHNSAKLGPFSKNEATHSSPTRIEHKESRPNSPDFISLKDGVLSSGHSWTQPNPTKRLAAVPQSPASAYRENLESPQMSNLTLELTPSTLAIRQSNSKKSPKRSPVPPNIALVAMTEVADETSPRNESALNKPRTPRSPYARPSRQEALKSPLGSSAGPVQDNLADDTLSPSNWLFSPSDIKKNRKKMELHGHSGFKTEKHEKSGLLSKAQRSKSTSRLSSRIRSPYSAKKNMPRSSSVPKVLLPTPKSRRKELQVNTAASDESLWTDTESPIKSAHASTNLLNRQETSFQMNGRLKKAPKDCKSIVTDEFLARIASRKGSRITAAELQMLLESTTEELPPPEVIETVLSGSSRGSDLLSYQYKQNRACMGFWDFWGNTDGTVDRRELLEEEESGPTWAYSHYDDDDDYYSENLSYEEALAIRTSRPSFSFSGSGSDECEDDDDVSFVTYEEEDEEDHRRSGWSWW